MTDTYSVQSGELLRHRLQRKVHEAVAFFLVGVGFVLALPQAGIFRVFLGFLVCV